MWVGTTSVPSGPSASSSAPTIACGPPHTQPSADIDVCTSSTLPGRTPERAEVVREPGLGHGGGAAFDAARFAGHRSGMVSRAGGNGYSARRAGSVGDVDLVWRLPWCWPPPRRPRPRSSARRSSSGRATAARRRSRSRRTGPPTSPGASARTSCATARSRRGVRACAAPVGALARSRARAARSSCAAPRRPARDRRRARRHRRRPRRVALGVHVGRRRRPGPGPSRSRSASARGSRTCSLTADGAAVDVLDEDTSENDFVRAPLAGPPPPTVVDLHVGSPYSFPGAERSGAAAQRPHARAARQQRGRHHVPAAHRRRPARRRLLDPAPRS